MEQNDIRRIDVSKNLYPFCIVWTPIPLISALFPFIGHTGVCTSDGLIHDFSGSYSITIDDMLFGSPTKYVKLEIENAKKWDENVEAADSKFREQTHNLCFNNCHSHVAEALTLENYQNKTWNMVKIAWILVIKGKYTGFSGFLKSYIGFFILMGVIILIWNLKS